MPSAPARLSVTDPFDLAERGEDTAASSAGAAPGASDDPLGLNGSDEIVPTRLGDTVHARLAQAITSGRLRPGAPVPSESRIAASFGVSKQIAREAIRELSALGAIHVQQGKTSRIRAVDGTPLARFYRLAVGDGLAGLQQVVELRQLIEPGIAALAAQRRSDDDLVELWGLLADLQAAIGRPVEWIRADMAFHRSLGRISGNRLIGLQFEALEPMIRRMQEQFIRSRGRSPSDWQETWLRHQKVVKAIEAGDAGAAFQAMTDHFERAPVALDELQQLMAGESRPPG